MSEIFNVEIITPDKLLFKSDTTEVVIPSFEGEMGILKDHIPLITFLRPGIVNIKNSNDEKKYYIEEGVVEFANNNLLILTSNSKALKDLNDDFINNEIQDAEKKLDDAEIDDKEKYLLDYKINTLREIRN
tara:strand:+ start:1122 stop:1514 length:393 start_codon:yes stop_codon:yes gene_type:complete